MRFVLGIRQWMFSTSSIQFTEYPLIRAMIIYSRAQAKMDVFSFSIPDSILVLVIVFVAKREFQLPVHSNFFENFVSMFSFQSLIS